MYYSPDCREHPLAKKKWSYLHFSSIFSTFSISFSFIVIFLKTNFLQQFWNDCYYTIRERSSVGYIEITLPVCLPSVPPSICPSVHLSVWLLSVDMILSTHVLGNGCMEFSENLNTNYMSSEDVHLEFSCWLDNFSSFCMLFFCFWTKSFFF